MTKKWSITTDEDMDAFWKRYEWSESLTKLRTYKCKNEATGELQDKHSVEGVYAFWRQHDHRPMTVIVIEPGDNA